MPRLFSIAADWKANGPVLWDPHLTAGNGLLAQFALPPLAPDVLLSFVLSPFAAYTVNTFVMVFAAGLSMHLFLRDSLRLPVVACLAGGILATTSFWHYIYGYAALLLPLLLWSIDRVSRVERRRRDIVVAILLVTFLLASSQVQIVLIDGAVVLCWVLFRGPGERSRSSRVASVIAIWGIAAMIAAPILLSQLAAISASQRTIWELSFETTVVGQLREAFEFYGRVILGVPVRGSIGGSGDVYGTFFLGALALPLLVVGCVVPRRSGRERFVLALVALIPLIDILTPLLGPLQERVVILQSFQFVRVRHLLPIVLIINAAIGIAWLASPVTAGAPWRLGRTRRLALVAGLVGVGITLAWQLRVVLRHALGGTGTELRQEGWALALVAIGGGSVVAVIVGLALWRRIRRGAGGRAILAGGVAVALLVAIGGERLAMTRSQRDLGPAALLGTWADRVATTPAQSFIVAQGGGGRIISIGDHANRALVAGLDAVDGYQTIYPLRYHELFGVMIAPQLVNDEYLDGYFRTWGNRAYAFGPALDMNVADLLGVRWLYVRGTSLADSRLAVRFAASGVTVYENTRAFPRAFVVHYATVLADRSELAGALGRATSEDLRIRVYLANADIPVGWDRLPEGPEAIDPATLRADSATIVSDAIDTVVVRVRTAERGILVLADTWTPDWVADVDGVVTPIMPADIALRGVAIEAGDHVVTMRYRPTSTYLGIALALLAIALVAGWLVVGSMRQSMRHRLAMR